MRRRGSVVQDIDAFNKVPYALAVAGHPNEARALLRWIESRSPSEGFASNFLRNTRRPPLRSYYLAWLAVGAETAGLTSTRDQALSAMLKFQNARFGGFYSEKRPHEEGVLHVVVTSLCGYACIRTGRTHEAAKAGEFIVMMVKAQPDPRKLYYRLDTEKGLLLNYPVDSAKKRQIYTAVGSGILFLCELYRATKKERYIETARALFNFGLSCRCDIFQSFPGGKFGWGSSLLYRIEGNPLEKRVAERIASYLVQRQKDDGSWPVLEWPRWDETLRFWRFLKTTLTAEFVTTLCKISENLS